MNHYPTYRSPIQLLNELGLNASEINTEALKTERKRLLLELQISTDQTVIVGNRTLTKNDVIQVFDELNSITDLGHHQRIFSHPIFLHLLDKTEISDSIEEKEQIGIQFESEIEEESFKDFVSPYLANAIDKVMSGTIRHSSYDQFKKIIPFFRLLNEVDALFAFRKFNSFCETLEPRLDHASAVNSVFPFHDFLFLRDVTFYNIANEVNKHYMELANLLAHTLINFTIDKQENSGRANHLYKIYKRLCNLNCSNELKSIIFQNEGGFKRDTLLRITDTFGIGWRYIIIGSIVGIFLILSFTFGDVDFEKAYARSNQQKEQTTVDRFPYEIQRMTHALKQQSQIGSKSPNRTAHFDLTAFKLFHDSLYSQIAMKNLRQNLFIQDSLPNIVSPLCFKDSAQLIPFGRKMRLCNNTDSDMLLIAHDRNSLSSYFIPSKFIILVELDPRSSVFFYSGKNWNPDFHLRYNHPYKSLMSDSITLSTTGYFEQSSSIELEFMTNLYMLKDGSKFDLVIDQVDKKYVFLGRVNNSYLKTSPPKYFLIPRL